MANGTAGINQINTTWYATFDKENEYFIIRNVINNHTKDYPDFISSISKK